MNPHQNDQQTTKRRPPANGKKFSKDNQPLPEAKSAGKMKKKKGMELAKAVLDLTFKGMKDSALKKAAAEYYGIDESEITVEMMLLFRQAEKAIQKADTLAFNAIMDRAHGKPKQDLSHDFTADAVVKIGKKVISQE
jgi:hypothetical protein